MLHEDLLLPNQYGLRNPDDTDRAVFLSLVSKKGQHSIRDVPKNGNTNKSGEFGNTPHCPALIVDADWKARLPTGRKQDLVSFLTTAEAPGRYLLFRTGFPERGEYSAK
jgi:hypothetical protein